MPRMWHPRHDCPASIAVDKMVDCRVAAGDHGGSRSSQGVHVLGGGRLEIVLVSGGHESGAGCSSC